MKEKFVDAYIDVADRFSKLSSAKRLQVGAIVVKDDRIISIGYNGMPAGWDNNCEDKEYMSGDAGGWLNLDEIEMMWPLEDERGRYKLKTKKEVLHAESNCLAKLARSSESGLGADIFVTHSPCLDCAKLIYQSGIKRVYFSNAYRSSEGVEFLRASGIEVTQIEKGQ
jgi:dCMP deaminase